MRVEYIPDPYGGTAEVRVTLYSLPLPPGRTALTPTDARRLAGWINELLDEHEPLPVQPIYTADWYGAQQETSDWLAEQPEPETYTRWDLTSIPEDPHSPGTRRVHARMETNDDNDDGFPDAGPVTVWERDLTEAVALDLAGQKSHTGSHGQPVTVYLDEEKI